ncbi:MAG: hypothetical protein QM767_03820 [Anaeromyxobacter sp.]
MYRWKRFAYCGLFDREKPLKDYTDEEMDLFLYADQLKLPNPDPRFPRPPAFDGVVTRMRDVYVKNRPRISRPRCARSWIGSRRTGCAPSVRGPAQRGGAGEPHRGAIDRQLAGARSASRRGWSKLDASPRWRRPWTASAPPLDALLSVGLGYLSLDRESSTLSGGEAQRVKIVRHLGSALTDVTYVFDEPSTGLHPADVQRLNRLLLRLRDAGNTVLVVEHHPQVIRVADHVVDIGPGAGADGRADAVRGDAGVAHGKRYGHGSAAVAAAHGAVIGSGLDSGSTAS